jgi:hypothetical protein
MSRLNFERAMRTLAATAGRPAPLPDADLVWQRAAARAQWRQYELATQPIRLAERAACIACAVTGVVGLLVLRPGIEAALRATDQTLVRLGGMMLAVTAAVALVLVKTLLTEE